MHIVSCIFSNFLYKYIIFWDIYSETKVALRRLNEDDIDETIWQRYEQYRTTNRIPSHNRGNTYSNNNNRPYPTNNPSYPRSNYYRDYYTGNNYEDEDGMLLNNEYDDFGDDFFQEDIVDEFDMPFRKYGMKTKFYCWKKTQTILIYCRE